MAKRFSDTQQGQFVQRLEELTQPTLILWGEQDHLIPLKVGHQLQKKIANSKLISFGDLGHVPHEEDPLKTVKPVIEFLNNN